MFYFKVTNHDTDVYYKISECKDFHEAHGVVYGYGGGKIRMKDIRGKIIGDDQFKKDMQAFSIGVVCGRYKIKNISEIGESKCVDCKFYRRKVDRYGECMYEPPQTFFDYESQIATSKRPSVYEIDFCGKFKGK